MTPPEQRGDVDGFLFDQRLEELLLRKAGTVDYVCGTWAPYVHPDDIAFDVEPDLSAEYAGDPMSPPRILASMVPWSPGPLVPWPTRSGRLGLQPVL